MSNDTAQIFRETRAQSLAFCAPLHNEDYSLQAEPFVSPPKWHLAHTTWFFETFLLKPFSEGYLTPDPRFEILFNSYYNGIGEQFPRAQRGLLSRPTVEEVIRYREHVDAAMHALLTSSDHAEREAILTRTTLGVEHERQHQELFFTDIKYSLAINPLLPIYESIAAIECPDAPQTQWLYYEGGLVEAGFAGESFCFDNELPRHNTYLESFELADRLVTNAEYALFVDDGGYQRPEFWLADGWTKVQEENWQAPLYWLQRDGEALEFTLHGALPRQPANPVCHVSGYEADAYARWVGARLPTEFEWEFAAASAALSHPASALPKSSDCVDGGHYHPRAADTATGLRQLYGDCWQWTRSAYGPYPGFSASPGAIGEYNGKFMSNQWVLRGGSCVSKASHLRPTYRNFFYPQDRWQFSGIRLARTPDSS